MHIYEYLFTAIIIVIILLSSSTMMGTFSEPSRSVSEKEQLKVAAQKLMTQLLLDPGDPPDWGSNIAIDESNLKTFGLAQHSETTREAYVLDPDKVLRLDNTHPLYIPPSSVINLLNLGYEYGFTLEIFPALNVSIAPQGSSKYKVSVSSEYGGLPIVDADVTARMYYVSNGTIQRSPPSDPLTNQTRANGECTLNFGSISGEMKVLILVINYHGVRVVKVFPAGSNVTRAYLIGEHLFLKEAYNISRNEAYEIIVEKRAGGYMIEDVKFSLNKMGDVKFNLTYVEPSTIAVLAVSEDGTRLIFTSKEVNLTYSSIPGVWSFPFAYSIERSVIIGGSAYIMRLYLWRMSW